LSVDNNSHKTRLSESKAVQIPLSLWIAQYLQLFGILIFVVIFIVIVIIIIIIIDKSFVDRFCLCARVSASYYPGCVWFQIMWLNRR